MVGDQLASILSRTVQAQDVSNHLNKITSRLGALSQIKPKSASAWLERAPYESAMTAIRKVWWQLSSQHWRQGGRELAEALNAQVFQETSLDFQNKKKFDGRILQQSINGTQHIVATKPRGTAAVRCNTEIWFKEQDTLDAAHQMRTQFGLNPLVLDMANKQYIGGAPRKASTQEENICRRSTLYPALQTLQDLQRPEQYRDKISSGGVYVPSVQVFRRGTDAGYAYCQPFTCAVFAAAAFNCQQGHRGYDRPKEKRQYEEATKQKIRDMFRVAYEKGHDSLLLGAFGCGAFYNDPGEMAQFYVDVLSEQEFSGLFKNVTFAIIKDRVKSGSSKDNYSTFLDTFLRSQLSVFWPGKQEHSSSSSSLPPLLTRRRDTSPPDSCWTRVCRVVGRIRHIFR
ncbi:MAG: TIGR02452 family protein [Chlamydiae bacterium RIFCSPHIGHO2_12_FULL_44_59]|nr:MAG: TIGR02452 family protein [Chlamydiae bacterium RIFCSPHIGHO2_01_FULL_44_39]OGN57322.1 MAG: TIGR02452 family protein [Chlamydiae bacterium RIFCSPHIGHO2_02_FULL_45_9]OGN60819.1 MAG: TIGR02452 family protein [Chlamydiae bacterium RIFCSPHIGHO2_12_FULL_44_59]OGN66695.1 MAG: TIGR02452 family protein [Chlamydiae bacterium RIFCSPLOWO2_01_FULL_44_52]OGN67345.1 MAG: TIGR02452 family protein [Chlamydiae bacterium RIFCSPLOWO2_02_FULL_45_22]